MERFFARYRKVIIWAMVVAFFVGSIALYSLQRFGATKGTSTGDYDTEVPATVNGTTISSTVFEQASADLLNQYEEYYRQIGQDISAILSGASGALLRIQVQASAMQSLIREVLLDQEIERYGIKIPKAKIDSLYASEYNSLLESYDISEDQLSSILQNQGRTLDEYKAAFRDSIRGRLRNEALRERAVGSIEPTEEELRSYFENDISAYETEEEIRASHILVQDEETASQILEELALGQSFAELAKEYSTDTGTVDEGGDLGWFSRGQMVIEFEQAAFALEKGEISKPVKTDYGYHIIQLVDRQAASTPTLEEVKDQVRDDYIAQLSSERFNDWYQEILAQADIKINRPLINAYLQQQEDTEAGLAEFERIREEGLSNDSYLPYYIGSIYESKMVEVASQRADLEKAEEKTEEEIGQIEELSQQIDSYKQEALSLYLETLEDVEADEGLLDRILALDPDNVVTIYRYGKLLVEQGNPISADMRFEEAITKDPSYFPPYMGSGDVAMNNKNYRRAAEQYRQALELRPTDLAVMTKLSGAYLALQQLDEAEKQLVAIQEIDPDNLALSIGLGDLAYARMILAINERDALEEKPERIPEEETQLQQLADTISAHYETARKQYEKALTTSGSADLYVKLGRVELARGEFAQAERAFHDAAVRSPYKAEAYEGMGDLLMRQGDIEGAIEEYMTAFSRSFDNTLKQRVGEEIIKHDPNDTTMRFKLADIYADQYMWSAAIRQYAAIIETSPDLVEAYEKIAEAYIWRTEYDTAIDYLWKAIGYADNDSSKISIYNKIIEIDQTQVGQDKPLSVAGLDSLFELARIYLVQGNLQDARGKLEQIISIDPFYNAEDVVALLLQAGGELPEPSIPEETVQTPSSIVTPPVDEAQTPSSSVAPNTSQETPNDTQQ